MVDKEATSLEELREKCRKYVAEINRLEFQAAHLQSENVQLKAQLRHGSSLRNAAREFYIELDRYILGNIDSRGHRRKSKVGIRTRVDTAKLEGMLRAELLYVAKEHDAKAFFRYHAPKSTMKLHYRIASKTYRFSRDIARRVATKSFRLVKRGRG